MNLAPPRSAQARVPRSQIPRRQEEAAAGDQESAHLGEILVWRFQVLHGIPQADDVETRLGKRHGDEISGVRLEPEAFASALHGARRDVHADDAGKATPGLVQEEPVGAADLQQRSA